MWKRPVGSRTFRPGVRKQLEADVQKAAHGGGRNSRFQALLAEGAFMLIIFQLCCDHREIHGTGGDLEARATPDEIEAHRLLSARAQLSTKAARGTRRKK